MTAIERAREELAELSGVLAEFHDARLEQWSPQWMTMQSLLRRQADLLHEIQLLEGSAEVELSLVGGAEEHHRVEADFLANVLKGFQAALGAIAQTFIHGERGTRGVLPGDVLGASTLRVGAAAPGSFVVLMDGPRDRASQFTIEGSEQLPPFDEALEKIVDLFQATEAADPERLRTAISEIGSHRALIHIGHIARSLARTHTTATLVQRSAFFAETREARVTRVGAERLQELLSRTEQTTSTIYVEGRLSGVLWRRGIFELEREDGTVISGRVIGELRPTIQASFDQVVRAELERTVTVEADEQERITYRLVGVGPDLGLNPTLESADDHEGRRRLSPPSGPRR